MLSLNEKPPKCECFALFLKSIYTSLMICRNLTTQIVPNEFRIHWLVKHGWSKFYLLFLLKITMLPNHFWYATDYSGYWGVYKLFTNSNIFHIFPKIAHANINLIYHFQMKQLLLYVRCCICLCAMNYYKTIRQVTINICFDAITKNIIYRLLSA